MTKFIVTLSVKNMYIETNVETKKKEGHPI